MIFPRPRILAIDDNADDLSKLVNALNSAGISCLPIQFTAEQPNPECPHVRVIFVDLHLIPGPGPDEDQRHYAAIGGLLEESIKPVGPYLIVLWTAFADKADALKAFLQERLSEAVPKPLLVTALDKNDHLDKHGELRDPAGFPGLLSDLFQGEIQINALLNWEARILESAGATVSLLVRMARSEGEPLSRDLARVLCGLAIAAVGESRVNEGKFRAVNEALLPLLMDQIVQLPGLESDAELWNQAFDLTQDKKDLAAAEIASLNRFLHIAPPHDSDTGATRGVVSSLPDDMPGDGFGRIFGIDPAEAAVKEFGCNVYEPVDVLRWGLVQIQAACDHAQHQNGPLPFALALELPAERAKSSKSTPNALWQSPVFETTDGLRRLHVSQRFVIGVAELAAKQFRVLYRLRDQLLSELVFHIHSHSSRPGITSF